MSRPNIFKSNNNNNNNKTNSSRFSFINDELNLEQNPKINEQRNVRYNLFSRQINNTVTQSKVVEQPKIQDDLKTFPVLGLGKIPSSDTKILEPTPIINNSYLKAIKHENVVIFEEEDKDNDEVRRKAVKPGWVSIFKNKSGKREICYGPKTNEERQNEYRDSSMNYQMYLAITRMEERWTLEKQRYDAIHGPDAYNDSYGYTPTYESDDESDYDSDYEYE